MPRGSGPKTAEFRGDPKYVEAANRLSRNVRALRARRGWSQEEAAAHCRLVPRVLQMVEAGSTNATLVTLTRLASGFEVEVGALFQ